MSVDGTALVAPQAWRAQVDALLLHHGVVGQADSALSKALGNLIVSWEAERAGEPVHPWRAAHRQDPSQWGPTEAQTEMAIFLDDERDWGPFVGEAGPEQVLALVKAAWSLGVEQQHHHSPGWSMSKQWAGQEVRRAFEPFLTSDQDAVDSDAVLAAARRGGAALVADADEAGTVDAVDVHDLANATRADLVAHVQRLHSWDGLTELLDEHWPADLFPTLDDADGRDPGPRIVSLLRWLDLARGDAAAALDQAAYAITAELICCTADTPCGHGRASAICKWGRAGRAIVLDHLAAVQGLAPGGVSAGAWPRHSETDEAKESGSGTATRTRRR